MGEISSWYPVLESFLLYLKRIGYPYSGGVSEEKSLGERRGLFQKLKQAEKYQVSGFSG